MAKALVNFCFELVEQDGAFDAQDAAVPEGAVRVYVINHRSNADSVVLSYGLLRRIALSYAVGEWARIWPLNYLFRAFGSYFVRRGEKDPIYHKVLERFLPIVSIALQRGAATVSELRDQVETVLQELRDAGAPIALGKAFAHIVAGRSNPGAHSIPGSNLDTLLLNHEEAELLTSLALRGLTIRRVVKRSGDDIGIVKGEEPIVAYYANSIRYHLEGTAIEAVDGTPVS